MTDNPMYAWIELARLLTTEIDLTSGTDATGNVAIPAWIAAYLRDIANDLSSLSAGLDPRIEPSDTLPVGAPFTSPDDYMNSPEFQADLRRRTIGLDEAMKLVPYVLGLTREGWNAFASLKSTTEKMQQFRTVEALRAQGMSAQDATEAVKETFGRRTDRSMQKRIAEGQRLAEGKASEPPK